MIKKSKYLIILFLGFNVCYASITYLLSPEEIQALSDNTFEFKINDQEVSLGGKWPKDCIADTQIQSHYVNDDLIFQIQVSDECVNKIKKHGKNNLEYGNLSDVHLEQKKRLRLGGFPFLTKVKNLSSESTLTSTTNCIRATELDKNLADIGESLTKCLASNSLITTSDNLSNSSISNSNSSNNSSSKLNSDLSVDYDPCNAQSGFFVVENKAYCSSPDSLKANFKQKINDQGVSMGIQYNVSDVMKSIKGDSDISKTSGAMIYIDVQH